MGNVFAKSLFFQMGLGMTHPYRKPPGDDPGGAVFLRMDL